MPYSKTNNLPGPAEPFNLPDLSVFKSEELRAGRLIALLATLRGIEEWDGGAVPDEIKTILDAADRSVLLSIAAAALDRVVGCPEVESP